MSIDRSNRQIARHGASGSGAAARFLRREDGAATIEAVLWLPFFIMLFALLVDLVMIFHGQSHLLRVVQDANRNYSVGRLTSTAETQNFIITQLGSISPNALASTTMTAGLITSTASVPLTDLEVFGVAEVFNGNRITVKAEHLMEN